MKRSPLYRLQVRYRCGAVATIEFPEEGRNASGRLAYELGTQDCPDCAGDVEQSGGTLRLDGQKVHYWRWRDTTAREGA